MTPTEVVEQRASALQKANAIRVANSQMLKAIARGDVVAADVIYDPSGPALSARIGQVLAAQRKWGPTRVVRFLRTHGIDRQKRLGELTERQRNLIAAELDEGNA